MQIEPLIYLSRVNYINFVKPFKGLKYRMDENVYLSEIYKPNPSYYGEYQIQVLAMPKTRSELHRVNEKIEYYCHHLNYLATYVIGEPLNRDTKDSWGSLKYFKEVGKIDSWENNFREVDGILQRVEKPDMNIFPHFTLNNPSSKRVLDRNPLKELIKLLELKDRVQPLILDLIYFHQQALMHQFDIRYLILGKALEIAVQFLPDKSYKESSFNQLPKGLREIFGDKNTDWLYNMSNNRYETRHVINKKTDSFLHSPMSEAELKEFAKLSDNLIRYIVRSAFGLDELYFV